MKGKPLALAVSLAMLAMALILGALPAAGGVTGTGPVTVDVPTTSTAAQTGTQALTGTGTGTQAQSPVPACADGVDNDNDGKLDFEGDNADPGCESPTDLSELDEPGGNGEEGDDSEAEVEGEDEGDEKKSKDKKKKSKKKRKSKDKKKSKKKKSKKGHGDHDHKLKPSPRRKRDGTPTAKNPNASIVDVGPAPVGVPNITIDKYSIPPFLLPIYRAAGIQYNVKWEILAAINQVETNYGRNLNVSSAGALGWMQFMPATWKAYGVDANADGKKDPYNPVDAIFAAARYLKAAGADKNLRKAIFAYNHANWYVDMVLVRARLIAGLPPTLVDSVSGLAEGYFPVHAKARYANDIDPKKATRRATPSTAARAGNRADMVKGSGNTSIDIFSRRNAPVVAVSDSIVTKVGRSRRLGRYIKVRDGYGNTFVYAGLAKVAKYYPVPKPKRLRATDFRLVRPKKDPKPTRQASAKTSRDEVGNKRAPRTSARVRAQAAKLARQAARDSSPSSRRGKSGVRDTEGMRERLFAYPERPSNIDRAEITGQLDALLAANVPGFSVFKSFFASTLKFNEKTMTLRRLRKGSRLTAGTVLGRIGKVERDKAPHVNFAIRPAGKKSPYIDPKPILDGWKLLEATAIYRAAGKNPFIRSSVSAGQVLLMGRESLQRRILGDPNIEIYSCGRQDVRMGRLDQRVLAALAYLSARGFRMGITSLRCGREGSVTTSGNTSNHSYGGGADIAVINGKPVLGNQGKGSPTEALVKEMLKLQGKFEPDELITLMDFGGPSFAMADHADHVHIGYRPAWRGKARKAVERVLKRSQWKRLIGRLYEIDSPKVRRKPSKYALPVKRRD